jgi:hypothetical protein
LCCAFLRFVVLQDATKGTNTTLLIAAKVQPISGVDLAGLVSAIKNAQPPIFGVDPGAYVNVPADVLQLFVSFNSNIEALQSVLMSRVVRHKMKKMTVKVSRNAARRTTKRGATKQPQKKSNKV